MGNIFILSEISEYIGNALLDITWTVVVQSSNLCITWRIMITVFGWLIASDISK